jgi:type IV secretory pathway VirJ component
MGRDHEPLGRGLRLRAAAFAAMWLCACAAREDAPAGVDEAALPPTADRLVVVLSGIGGWRNDIDRLTAEALAGPATAVVGFDSPAWFGIRRSPEDVAGHLASIIDHYVASTGATEVALVGYSFGANTLPAAYNAMAAARQDQIGALVMIAPNRRARETINILHRLGWIEGRIDLAPELARIPKNKLACIYPAAERAVSGCTLPSIDGALVIELPGDHDFDDDAAAVSAAVEAAFARSFAAER